MSSYLVQQVFSSISALAPNLLDSSPANGSGTNATATASSGSTPSSTGIPTDFAGLVSLLFTFSALRDWLKLIVIGGLFESCRRFFAYFYQKALEGFYMNAYFEEDDPSYTWMMVWLSKQPSWGKARDVAISTESYGNTSTAVLVDKEDESESRIYKSSKKLTYYPSLSKTYTMWYKGRYMTITRTQENTGWYGHKERTLHISILTRSNTFLIDLLREARREYMAAQEHSMCVFVSDINNNWRHVACRAKRSLRSVVLDPGIKDLVLDDARDFLDSKQWYAERGIPFRRGYLLYGAPGSGKTSLIHCLAGELGLDVYVISLSRTGMDDSALDQLVNELPERCVALMEDIDAAFTSSLNRDQDNSSTTAPNSSSSSTPDGKPAKPDGPAPPPPNNRLSLSGLLNALDGIGAQEGRILFATTNHYRSLDPALCRPGRMDLHIEFKLASKYQARELFTRFYLPGDHPEEEEEKEKVKKEDNEKVDDSGYASSVDASSDTSSEKGVEGVSDAAAAAPDATGDDKGKAKDTTALENEKPHVIGHRHSHGPVMSPKQVKELAAQFAEAIPDREVSMASLQGFLMSYKVRPFQAVKDAPEWVIKERKEREEKEKERMAKAEREKKEAEEKAAKEAKEKKEAEEKEKKEKEEKEKKEAEEKEKKEKEKEGTSS